MAGLKKIVLATSAATLFPAWARPTPAAVCSWMKKPPACAAVPAATKATPTAVVAIRYRRKNISEIFPRWTGAIAP